MGKEKFEGVELDTDEAPELFKAQLFALSGVTPDRQKVMLKGSTIKDDSWGSMKIKNGITLLMMGTVGELPQAPQEKIVFMEDMSEGQLAAALDVPAGLSNLGNTCYMNATVQCLRNVPELRDALKKFNSPMSIGGRCSQHNPSLAALRDLYKAMDRSAESIPPIVLLQVLHLAFPQFAEKTEQGVYAQQDANECWNQVVRMLQQKLPAENALLPAAEASAGKGFIDQYFGVEYKSTMKCIEAEDEPEVISSETVYQLSCFISTDVKYMHTGLKNRLLEEITKNSPSLGRDAVYKKSSLISRLPAYLPIQMVRFYYKEKEAINAKILKDVKFPIMLDVFDLCTPELQKKLLPLREKFKEQEDKKLEESKDAKAAAKRDGITAPEPMEVDQSKDKKYEPYSFPDDIGSNNSGYYELTSVLTHQGRSSSSGHYVAWIRKEGDTWVKCDDDKVSIITSEDVLKLSGGGDWHCAYVLLYSPRKLEITEDSS